METGKNGKYTNLNTDKFLAIPASDGGLDDLVVRDKRIQMRDRKQGKAHAEEIENSLDEKSGCL